MTPKERRERLIHLLRNPSEWPSSFCNWDFNECVNCAMGLAAHTGIVSELRPMIVQSELGLEWPDFRNVFIGLPLGTYPAVSVTPDMVADKLQEVNDAILD
jgi:hypothetical protein